MHKSDAAVSLSVMKRISALLFVLLLAVGLAACGGGKRHPVAAHSGQTAGGLVRPAGWATQPPAPGSGVSVPTLPKATPTLEMFDAIYVSDMQSLGFTPRAVAGYTTGNWPSYQGLVAAYPHSYHLSIAVNAGQWADCLDIEPGDADASQAGDWVRWMLSLHRQHPGWFNIAEPCVYTSVSNLGDVNANVGGLPVKRWCAWYRYTPGLLNGCDAVQWTDHGPQGQNVDESTVAQSFFGPPPPPPDPYRIFSNVRYPFGPFKFAERPAARTYDQLKCRWLLRRDACKRLSREIHLLHQRLLFVAWHHLTAHGWVHNRHADFSGDRGPRNLLLARREHNYNPTFLR